MQEFFRRHAAFWTDKQILIHLGVSVVLFSVSLFFNYLAMTLTKSYTGYVVPDILLDNLPLFNVGFIFFQGAFLFIFLLLVLGAYQPRYIPFVLETTGLFFFVRSLFMVMTHLTAPNVEYYHYVSKEYHVPQILFTVSSGNDLFFSAHTGFPFLLALIFWHNKTLRLCFLVCSFIGAATVILGHLHYSIDVFSAFFISFGVVEMSKRFFAREYQILLLK